MYIICIYIYICIVVSLFGLIRIVNSRTSRLGDLQPLPSWTSHWRSLKQEAYLKALRDTFLEVLFLGKHQGQRKAVFEHHPKRPCKQAKTLITCGTCVWVLSNVHKIAQNLYCLVPFAPLGCVDWASGRGWWEARTQTNKLSNMTHWHSTCLPCSGTILALSLRHSCAGLQWLTNLRSTRSRLILCLIENNSCGKKRKKRVAVICSGKRRPVIQLVSLICRNALEPCRTAQRVPNLRHWYCQILQPNVLEHARQELKSLCA